MLSNKKLLFGSIITLLVSYSGISFAAMAPVECSTNTVFGANECSVCYKESIPVTGTGTGLEITDIKIPWKNTQTGVSEITYEIEVEKDMPEFISEHKVMTDPDVSSELWKFTNPWTGIGEYALASGKETTFYELIPEGSVKIYGK
jgi:D-arabinose 1-dehydrogenase-like Zn-dependent alcohol dehydrogenase